MVEGDHIGLDFWRADGEQVVVISPVNSDVRGAVPEFMLRSERKFLNDFAGIVQAKDIGLRGYPSFAGSMNDRGSHEHHISAKL